MDPKHGHAEITPVSADTMNSCNDKKTEPSIGGGVDISNKEDNAVPEEEWDALAALLREAYPSPKQGKITQNVMERIHAESAKISRQKKIQTWIRRYGGMAACVAILCGALFLVYPHLNRTLDRTADEEAAMTEAAMETLAETMAETEEETFGAYNDQAVGFAMPRSAAVTEEYATEEENEAEDETGAVQTYSATSLLKSVSMYAEADANADAADDSSLADGFLHYLLNEGYLTMEAYQDWLTQRDVQTVWEPEELCEAFGLEPSLYDAWLRK